MLTPNLWAAGGGDFGGVGSALAGNGIPGFIYTNVDEFHKALTSGYGTDAAAYTQGRALQFESLEAQLISVVEDRRKHFPFLEEMPSGDATSVNDQWTRRYNIGGYAGGDTNTESGTMLDRTGLYQRVTDEVKFLMTMASVTKVQESTRSQEDGVTVENENAILRLLRTAEFLCFYGDSRCVPTEFDGVRCILEKRASADHIVDMRGKSISSDVNEIINAAALVAGQGNFGFLTHMWMSNAMKGDMARKVESKYRVNITGQPGEVELGTPVRGINTDWGAIEARYDIWIKEGGQPFVARPGNFAAIVTQAGVTPPVSIAAASLGATSGSQFLAAHAGLFTWGVEGINKDGRSTFVTSAQLNVNAGDGVTLTITESNGGNEVAYMIHRTARNGASANGDFREMVRVPKNGGGTTTYTDLNQNIPGCSDVFLLNMNPGDRAITLRRLLPITQFALAATNSAILPWAVLFFLYLRIAIPEHHMVLKNCWPSTSAWNPFP